MVGKGRIAIPDILPPGGSTSDKTFKPLPARPQPPRRSGARSAALHLEVAVRQRSRDRRMVRSSCGPSASRCGQRGGPRRLLAEVRATHRVRRVIFGSRVPLRHVGVSSRVWRAPSAGSVAPQQHCQPPCLASFAATAVRANGTAPGNHGRTKPSKWLWQSAKSQALLVHASRGGGLVLFSLS